MEAINPGIKGATDADTRLTTQHHLRHRTKSLRVQTQCYSWELALKSLQCIKNPRARKHHIQDKMNLRLKPPL
jgi:hypothetical protein